MFKKLTVMAFDFPQSILPWHQHINTLVPKDALTRLFVSITSWIWSQCSYKFSDCPQQNYPNTMREPGLPCIGTLAALA
jgi:hypothetical protein